MTTIVRTLLAAALVPVLMQAQGSQAPSDPPRVGPANGTVIVVGGGSMGPEIYRAFIEAAGGPDALIITVPNAGGGDSYVQDGPSTRGWKAAGARNVYTLFTKDPRVADTDSFTAVIARAGGIWFEGGRQFRLVDAYAGTKTEAAFNAVLARGGVVGGSSAGASILGDFLVRGAPSNNNLIMDYPGYEKGFSYLRNVGIDQHVVARERLPDLADSIITKYPQLLGISEDEGTAWVVRGDTGTIVGRSKAFVYNGSDASDAGKPFLTLFPGDRYDLGARRVIERAAAASPVTTDFIDGLFSRYASEGAGQATVLVAKDGKILVDRAYGIAPQARYMPATTVPQFSLGKMSKVFEAICAQIPEPPARTQPVPPPPGTPASARPTGPAQTPLQRCVSQRAASPVGLHKTTATPQGDVQSNVDELYRVSLGLEYGPTFSQRPIDAGAAREPIDATKGWEKGGTGTAVRYQSFAESGGKRGAWLRFPDAHATVIILTDDPSADARGMAEAIAGKLLGGR